MPRLSIMKQLGIPTPTFQDVQLRNGNAGRLISGYFDVDGSIVKQPGMSLFKDFSASAHPIQGIYESETTGNVYVCYNNLLVKIAANGTATTITGTTLATDSPYASFTHDGTTMFVANNSKINKVNEGAGTATLISGGTAPDNVTHLGYSKGFLIANGLQSGGIAGDVNFSDDKANAYAAWELYNQENHPDATTALFVKWDEIAGWGSYSMESSWDDAVTPWAVIQGSQLHWGLRAPYSVAFVGEAFMFLTVMDDWVRFIRINARVPEDLSQKYETIIGAYTDAANAKAWGVTIRGKPFYVVTFPADDRTLIYNVRLNHWTELATWSGSAYSEHRINAYRYIRGWNKWLVGDKTDAKLFYLDDTFVDNSAAMRLEFTSAGVTHGSNRKKVQNFLTFWMKRGQAIDASEPVFSLEFRDNGGAWQTARNISLGLANDTLYFARVNRGGTYRSRQYRFVHVDTKSDFILTDVEEDFDWLAA